MNICIKSVTTIIYLYVGGLPCLEREDLAEEETCDTHLIEQTDRGYRCAIDVPSVLYKWVNIYEMQVMIVVCFHQLENHEKFCFQAV